MPVRSACQGLCRIIKTLCRAVPCHAMTPPLQVLVGHPDYEVTGGSAAYKGVDLLELEPEVRSHMGLFLR